MFKFLKDKISGFFKKEAPKKKSKKTNKKQSPKKEKKKSVKKEKIKEFQQEVEEIETTTPEVKNIEEEIKEEKPSFFSKLANRLTTSELSKEEFSSLFEEFEITLLENNVSLEVVDEIKKSLESDLVNKRYKKQEVNEKIKLALKESIEKILIEPPNFIEKINSSKPYVILFFGINGTGKTTSIAKIVDYLKKNKKSVVLAAADTFRAASIEQLKYHAKALNVPIVSHEYGSDPSAVAFDSIQYAKKHNIDVVLIDTAGRMYTRSNLMKEMEKIIKVSNPNLKIFVGESITGNDVIEQAKTFNETAGIDGIILSKADIDEKAGAVLSVSYITKKPIYFLGTGQNYKDLIPFTKKGVLKNLGLD